MISLSLRLFLLLQLFLWLVVIKFCNIIIDLRATAHTRLETIKFDVVTKCILYRVNVVWEETYT